MSEANTAIIEAANRFYSTLGAGYTESIYEEAMAVEFRELGLPYDVEKVTEVFYKGHKVGEHRLDFIVDGRIVVELKAASSISKGNVAQLQSYMKTLGLPEGILINFPYPDKEAPECQSHGESQ